MTEYVAGIAAMVPCILSIVTGVWDIIMAHAPAFALILAGFVGLCIKYALDLWLAARGLVNTSDIDEQRVLEHDHAESVAHRHQERMISDLDREEVDYYYNNRDGGKIQI